MAAKIISVTATPSTVIPGASSTVTVGVDNQSINAIVTITVDGSVGTCPVVIVEPLVFTTDATKIGARGYVVGSVDAGGTLGVGTDGKSFIFTAG